MNSYNQYHHSGPADNVKVYESTVVPDVGYVGETTTIAFISCQRILFPSTPRNKTEGKRKIHISTVQVTDKTQGRDKSGGKMGS